MRTPEENQNNKLKEMYDDLSDLEVIQVDVNRPVSTKPGPKRFGTVADGFWNESATGWLSAYVTWIIAGGLVVAYVLQGILGEKAVIDACSVNWPTVFGKFQIWRLFTCIFPHSDLKHLAGNLILLIICGVLLEKRVARKRVMVIFLAGGLFASLCSAVINHVLPVQIIFSISDKSTVQRCADLPSVGASGAVAALLSATLLFPTVFPKPEGSYMEYRYQRGVLGGLFLFYILVNATGGVFTKKEFVDTAAHLGGFLAGTALMLIYWVLDMQKHKWDD